jgi:hypothetical protein
MSPASPGQKNKLEDGREQSVKKSFETCKTRAWRRQEKLIRLRFHTEK